MPKSGSHVQVPVWKVKKVTCSISVCLLPIRTYTITFVYVCVSICPVHAVLHKRVGVNGNVKVCGYCKEVLLLLALLYH